MGIHVVLCQILTSYSCVRVVSAKALDSFKKRGGQVFLCILEITLQVSVDSCQMQSIGSGTAPSHIILSRSAICKPGSVDVQIQWTAPPT